MKTGTGLLVTVIVFSLLGTVWAEPLAFPTRSSLAPETLFIKAGLASHSAAFSVGAGWDKSDWLWAALPDVMSLSLEAEIGHWQAFDLRHEQAEFTQIGLTPMLRFPLLSAPDYECFAEGGVGFHFITPLYRTQKKRFSTSFNFQDLLGIGLRFGAGRHHEVVLYGSHFSNGAINEPNPGENFLQIRYLRHLD